MIKTSFLRDYAFAKIVFMSQHTYFIQGGNTVTLHDHDFIAQGGEGLLYAQGDWAYKIYSNPSTMPPAAKIQALAVLDRENIIRPQALLLDAHHQPVGVQMAYVADTVALPRLLTNDYRHAHHIEPHQILKLLHTMRETIDFIHDQQCLLVDANEMNYLVDSQQHAQVYFIDVDSYQTPHFPATAIMPSIRDYHSPDFSELTDWFAFAIVACQLLVGIHPYKGKHPQFNKKDLAARMQANVSIFNPHVSVPAAVRDFSLIPSAWRNWFERLFEQGERCAPPPLNITATAPALTAPTLRSTQQLHIQLRQSFAAPIHACHSAHGHLTVFAGQQAHLDGGVSVAVSQGDKIIYTPRTLQPMLAHIEQGQLRLMNLHTQTPLSLNLKADHLLLSGHQLFCAQQNQLTAIKLHELNQHCVAAPGSSWNIMPRAHQVLDGLLYQNLLGEPYLLLPQAQACSMIHVPELRGYHIIEGKFEAGVAMLMGYQHGQYDLLCLRFSEDLQHYQWDVTASVEQAQINFVALDNGVVVQLTQEGELTLRHRLHNTERQIRDPAIRSDMRLCQHDAQVLAYQAHHLYSLKLV